MNICLFCLFRFLQLIKGKCKLYKNYRIVKVFYIQATSEVLPSQFDAYVVITYFKIKGPDQQNSILSYKTFFFRKMVLCNALNVSLKEYAFHATICM